MNLYKEKKFTIPEISKYMGICEGTIRIWLYQYTHSHNQQYKAMFKNVFIYPSFTYRKFTEETGVSRATAIKWRKELFPEMTGTRQLFKKLIDKQDLSTNELSLLLNITPTVVRRYKHEYKMQGYEMPNDKGGNREPEKIHTK